MFRLSLIFLLARFLSFLYQSDNFGNSTNRGNEWASFKYKWVSTQESRWRFGQEGSHSTKRWARKKIQQQSTLNQNAMQERDWLLAEVESLAANLILEMDFGFYSIWWRYYTSCVLHAFARGWQWQASMILELTPSIRG
ncbi:uncharacterized protein LOC131223794 [Magnolia sinica]|uniref:uncharacterized protein LOC131223794 n=1 Tax=Magnolia sinica TaxID=86752 RepID=UPI00265B132B|nr:uncharacterized protein LOC131223794 [Magnolia sinica]